MNGTAIPSNLDRLLPFLQFSHRIVAALVGVLAAWVVVRAWRSGPGAVRRLGVLLGTLFGVEILIGGVNVFSRLHAASVTTHLALGAAIWCTLVALWAVARWQPSASLQIVDAYAVEDPQRTTTREKVGAYLALT